MTASYALVTPARDECENLRRLGAALAAQTVPPAAWVIVDNGSTDATATTVTELAQRHPWIRLASCPGTPTAVPGAPIVRAFHAGVTLLPGPVDVIVKTDADVSMAPDYFERLLASFADDPTLGIAAGECYELTDGEWRPTDVSGSGVRGAVRAYRRECLAELLPLPERTGWDTIDELQAAVRGWSTRVVPSLRFDHHRALGARDGGRSRRWRAQGSAAYYLGYSPLYLVLRSCYRALRGNPAALTMAGAYVSAALRREPRHPDAEARALLRRRQSVRHLGARALRRLSSSAA